MAVHPPLNPLAQGRGGIGGSAARSSSSQTSATPSLGARQSPRGLSAPPALTLGPLGIALRLNWLKAKNRRRNSSSQCAIVARSYSFFFALGKPSGHAPARASFHAFQARKAILPGLWPQRIVWWRKKSLSS